MFDTPFAAERAGDIAHCAQGAELKSQTDYDSARRPNHTIAAVPAMANRMRACRAPLRVLAA
jgi:hypothetical protein